MSSRDLTPEIDAALEQMDLLLAKFKQQRKGPPKTSKATRMAFKAITEIDTKCSGSGVHKLPETVRLEKRA